MPRRTKRTKRTNRKKRKKNIRHNTSIKSNMQYRITRKKRKYKSRRRNHKGGSILKWFFGTQENPEKKYRSYKYLKEKKIEVEKDKIFGIDKTDLEKDKKIEVEQDKIFEILLLPNEEFTDNELLIIANKSYEIYKDCYLNYKEELVKLDKNGESEELVEYHFNKVYSIINEVIKTFYVTYYKRSIVSEIIPHPIQQFINDLDSLLKKKPLRQDSLDKIEEIKKKLNDVRKKVIIKYNNYWDSPEGNRRIDEFIKIKERTKEIRRQKFKENIQRQLKHRSTRMNNDEIYQSGILYDFPFF